MIYNINNFDLHRTKRAKGKSSKSIYKNKVPNTKKHHQNIKTDKRDYKWTLIQRNECFHQSW